ncbi:MAG: hypothetical protein IV090_10520 [Candidatus Sericytochromatia bacterium]|nr:hypothetical protein [Candidatus Sericytochromatia bacterium]
MSGPEFNPFRLTDSTAFQPIKITEKATPQAPAKEGQLTREVVETAAKATKNGSLSKAEYVDLLGKMNADGALTKTEKGFLSHLLAGSNQASPSKLYQSLADFDAGTKQDHSFNLVDFDENGDQLIDEQDAFAAMGLSGAYPDDMTFSLVPEPTFELSEDHKACEVTQPPPEPMGLQELEHGLAWSDAVATTKRDVSLRKSEAEMRSLTATAAKAMVGSSQVMWGKPNLNIEDPAIHCPQGPFIAYVRAGILSTAEAKILLDTTHGNLRDMIGGKTWEQVPAEMKYELGQKDLPKPKAGDIAIFVPNPDKGDEPFHYAVFTGEGLNVVSVQSNLSANEKTREKTDPPTFKMELERQEREKILDKPGMEYNKKALELYRKHPDSENPTVETDLDTLLRSDFYDSRVIIVPFPFKKP